ncbi:MAG: ATP-binding protein [Polyangiales bacterium]
MSDQRSTSIYDAQLAHVRRDTDQLFFWILLGQWALAIAMAWIISPYAWVGRTRSIHQHVQMAVLFGGLLNVLPLLAIRRRSGEATTRHLIAAVQMLWSALLIDVTGGRIETHFHIFGSLAFLAFYRDAGVLWTATVVTALDHLLRGMFWPDAVYGAANPEWWRFLEHAAWVLFEVVVLSIGTSRALRDMRLLADRESQLEQTHAIVEQQVQVRTGELAESLSRYRALVENTNAIPWEIDGVTGKLRYIAPQAVTFFGAPTEQLQSERFAEIVHPDDRARLHEQFAGFMQGRFPNGDSVDYRIITGGRLMHVRTTVSYTPGEAVRGITIDISKQTKMEGELRQAQKLESVGKLAAGVAHEINTPVQFVSDSVHFVKGACDDMFALIDRYQRGDDAEAHAERIDLPYLNEQVPRALEMALEGLGRVTGIVRSMKEFAYPHTAEMVSVDLNQAIRSTLTIARGEYKYVADLETELNELPSIRCHIGDINQVVLNIVVNAAHAIAEKKTEEMGRIFVRTHQDGDDVIIAVEDTGGGIPEHLHERIYDPFFTTKAVGSGTGQGLSIARTIVVDRHHGALWFDSRAGVGTTFFIRLPIAGLQRREQTAA